MTFGHSDMSGIGHLLAKLAETPVSGSSRPIFLFVSCLAAPEGALMGGAVSGPLQAFRASSATPASAQTLHAEADLSDVKETTR